MVTPADFGLVAGKIAARYAPRLVFDFFKRRKLKAAYPHAAERVINYYSVNGYNEGTPLWHGIVNLIKHPQCEAALSVGGKWASCLFGVPEFAGWLTVRFLVAER